MTRSEARLSMLVVVALSASAKAQETGPDRAAAAGSAAPAASTVPSSTPPESSASREVAPFPAPLPPAPSAPATSAGPNPPPAPTIVALVPAPPPTDATVHVASDYAGAWLEGRSRVDLGEWRRLCPTPCDRPVLVDGLELRVTAPNMTPSNAFAIDPGAGTARLRVAGGSSSARNLGIIALAGGLPITFGGLTLFGLGTLQDEAGVKTAGIVTLAVGAAAIAVALPLLLSGSTTVKNEQGRYIAERRLDAWAF